jgi:hypothetical protein
LRVAFYNAPSKPRLLDVPVAISGLSRGVLRRRMRIDSFARLVLIYGDVDAGIVSIEPSSE